MIRAIRCELARLRSPYFLVGGVGLMTVLGLIATTIVFATAGKSFVGPPGAPKGVTVAALEASGGMFVGLQSAASMMGIIALVIWAIAVTSDYSSGMIRQLVQAEPSRLRLLAGKVVALAVLTCFATLVTTVVVLVVSPSIAGMSGVSTDAWRTGLFHAVVDGYVSLTLAALLWGVVGLFVGVVTRSSGVAVGVGIGYLIAFEGLAGMLLDSGSKWLPGSSFAAVASGGTTDMTYGTALLLAAGYALVAIGAAAATFLRRDITA
jgi:ABC-2 type transport system permease protein